MESVCSIPLTVCYFLIIRVIAGGLPGVAIGLYSARSGASNLELVSEITAKSLSARTGLWWALKDLNLRPKDYESSALTAELRARLA
jgi:hypothetical protein